LYDKGKESIVEEKVNSNASEEEAKYDKEAVFKAVA